MLGQTSLIVLGVLVLGIFIGSNLGIMLMVFLHMAKKADVLMEELAAAALHSDELES